MRSKLVFTICVVVASMASLCETDMGPTVFSCQPVCKYPDGSVAAGSAAYQITAIQQSTAVADCAMKAQMASPPVCSGSGVTVDGCSCEPQ